MKNFKDITVLSPLIISLTCFIYPFFFENETLRIIFVLTGIFGLFLAIVNLARLKTQDFVVKQEAVFKKQIEELENKIREIPPLPIFTQNIPLVKSYDIQFDENGNIINEDIPEQIKDIIKNFKSKEIEKQINESKDLESFDAQTLNEMLSQCLQKEQYEKAAQIKKELEKRK